MVAFTSTHAGSGARAALASFLLAIAASGGGCTLLVGGELSDKPLEGTGTGGGHGGAGGGGSSSASMSSSATGGAMCMPNTADCDGLSTNGCEAKLKTDSSNCGACKNKCDSDEHCKESKCQ